MALLHSIEENGVRLFKYRGQIPVVLFLMAVGFIYVTDYSFLTEELNQILLAISIALSVLGFVIRAYTIGTTPRGTSGRNTKEQVAESLNSSGIYSMVRHPLYLGNYFMWIGIVCYTYNIYFIVITSLLYWIYYERIMFAEERFLERKFGKDYIDWSMNIPAFWPKFSGFIKSSIPFSMKSVLRREYSGFFATVIGFLFVAIVRDWFTNTPISITYAYLFVGSGLVTLLLRTLKKTTKLLSEEGRS